MDNLKNQTMDCNNEIGIVSTEKGISSQYTKEKVMSRLGSNFDYALQLTKTLYGPESADDYELILNTYEDKINWKQAPKKEQWEALQINVSSVTDTLQFSSNEAVPVRNFSNKREAAIAHAIVTVPVSYTRAKKLAERNGKELIMFKAVPFPNENEAMMSEDERKLQETLLQKKLAFIYTYGITDVATGKHYMICQQSASQARQGSFWFYEAKTFDEVDTYRLQCMMLTKEQYDKLFPANAVLMSKLESRVGLSTSNTLDMKDVCIECRSENFISTINKMKVSVISDVYNTIKRDVVVPVLDAEGHFNGETKLCKDKEIDMNVSDGSGFMSVTACININYGLHLITDKEYRRALREWNSEAIHRNLDNIEEETWLYKFILKLSKIVQFRHAGDKGIISMWNIEAYTEELKKAEQIPDDQFYIVDDIVLHESVRKYDFGEWDEAPFEICMYDKKKSGIANMNFQFIQALDIPAEQLIGLADRKLSYVKDNIMTDAVSALKFLGIVNRIGDEDGTNDASTDRKLETVLRTDPMMISDPQMQKWLLEKVKKYITDIGIGKIPVEGGYYYILTDPRYLLDKYLENKGVKTEKHKHLKAGEFYLNNMSQDVAGFRPPLIHACEAQKLRCVKVSDLWWCTDVVIFNPCDGTAQAMGGADFDGDHILATWEKEIVDAVRMFGFILYDAGMSGEKVPNDWSHRIQHFLKTSVRDQTGYITNLATKWTDLKINWEIYKKECQNQEQIAHADIQIAQYDNCIKSLRFLQGWEIDSAKTGKNADTIGFPKYLKIKTSPDWFIGMREMQGRAASAKEVYVSKAPLGQLFSHVSEFYKEISQLRTAQEKTYYLSQTFTQEECAAVNSVYPMVREMEHSYCMEIAGCVSFFVNSVINKEQFVSKCNEISLSYEMRLLSLVNLDQKISTDVIAYACYFAANTKKDHVSKSCSFPWSCFFKGMIQLLYRNNNVIDLYALPENVEIDDMYVENGIFYLNDEPRMYTNCPNMNIKLIVIENAPFAVIPKIAPKYTKREEMKHQLPDAYKTLSVSVNGFKHHASMNSENFLHLIHENDDMFDIIPCNGNVCLSINGMTIANFATKTLASTASNHKAKLIHHSEPLFIPQQDRISRCQMKDARFAYSGQLTLEISLLEAIECQQIVTNVTPTFIPISQEYDTGYENYSGYEEDYSSLPIGIEISNITVL